MNRAVKLEVMKSRHEERVGESNKTGLSITLEGPDSAFVGQVTTEVVKTLEKQKISVKTDEDFTNTDEEVMYETLNLLDITKAPLSLKSRSLLSVVASQHRLSLISDAKKAGYYSLSNQSWLLEVVEALRKGKGELAGQLAFDNQGIRPDVWLILSHDKSDLYTRTAEQCGIPVIRSKKTAETVKEVMKHITYARTAHPEPTPPVVHAQETTPVVAPGEVSADKYPYLRDQRLGDKILMAYTLIMDKIFDNHAEITSQLTKQLGDKQKAEKIASGVLPITMLQPDFKPAKATRLSVQAVNRNGSYAQLLSVLPRNELDVIEGRYFAGSDYTHEQLSEGLLHMPYDQRAKQLEEFIAASTSLDAAAIYAFEVVAPISVLVQLKLQSESTVTLQTPTPLLGYDTPESIEQYGLTELYDQAFDLSLELYSLLQAAGLEKYTFQTVLNGHFARARISLPLGLLKTLCRTWTDDPYAADLLSKVLAGITDTHPLIGSILTSPQSAPTPKKSAKRSKKRRSPKKQK